MLTFEYTKFPSARLSWRFKIVNIGHIPRVLRFLKKHRSSAFHQKNIEKRGRLFDPKGMSKGVIFLEFGITMLILFLLGLFVFLSGIFLISFSNSYTVAKNFFIIVKGSDFLTEAQTKTIQFENSQNCQQPACHFINCSNVRDDQIFEISICTARSASRVFFPVFIPKKIVAQKIQRNQSNNPQQGLAPTFEVIVTTEFDFSSLVRFIRGIISIQNDAFSFSFRTITL